MHTGYAGNQLQQNSSGPSQKAIMGAMISRHQAGVEYQKQRGVCGGSPRLRGRRGGKNEPHCPLVSQWPRTLTFSGPEFFCIIIIHAHLDKTYIGLRYIKCTHLVKTVINCNSHSCVLAAANQSAATLSLTNQHSAGRTFKSETAGLKVGRK